ncbi:MAG TPA: hypothetical protein PL187_21980 [Caldilinea sp.]|nr:hypothetical protein [Caldilinea sp.]
MYGLIDDDTHEVTLRLADDTPPMMGKIEPVDQPMGEEDEAEDEAKLTDRKGATAAQPRNQRKYACIDKTMDDALGAPPATPFVARHPIVLEHPVTDEVADYEPRKNRHERRCSNLGGAITIFEANTTPFLDQT